MAKVLGVCMVLFLVLLSVVRTRLEFFESAEAEILHDITNPGPRANPWSEFLQVDPFPSGSHGDFGGVERDVRLPPGRSKAPELRQF
jgi:hypothetical protein